MNNENITLILISTVHAPIVKVFVQIIMNHWNRLKNQQILIVRKYPARRKASEKADCLHQIRVRTGWLVPTMGQTGRL